jgi:hypothetical protein
LGGGRVGAIAKDSKKITAPKLSWEVKKKSPGSGPLMDTDTKH